MCLVIIFILVIIILLQKLKENSILKHKHLRFKIHNNNLIIEGEKLMVLMTSVQFVEVTLEPKDLRGNPAPVENIVWESSDPTMLQVVPDEINPAKVRINALGPVGTAQVNVSADVNMDPEVVQSLSDFIAFEIRVAFASTLGMSITEPQDQEID